MSTIKIPSLTPYKITPKDSNSNRMIVQNSRASIGITTQGPQKQSTFLTVPKHTTFGGNDLLDYGVTNIKIKGMKDGSATPIDRIGKFQTVVSRMNRSNKRRKHVGGNRMGGKFGKPTSKGGKMSTLHTMNFTVVSRHSLKPKAKFSTASPKSKQNRRSTSSLKSTSLSNLGKYVFHFIPEQLN